MKTKGEQLRLVAPRATVVPAEKRQLLPLTTIDLFCGAGGITEGFREAGYGCLEQSSNRSAIKRVLRQ